MKKIIFIHHGGKIGGAPVSMLDLASSLDKKIYKPLIIFSDSGPIVDLAKKQNLETRVLKFKSIFFYGRHVKLKFRMLFYYFFYYSTTVKLLTRLIQKEKPSLIYLNTSVLVTAAIAAKKNNIPLIWSVREAPGINKFIRKFQINKIEQLSDHIFTTSNYVKKYFNRSKNITVLYNSIRISDYSINHKAYRKKIRSELNIPNNSVVVTIIGSVQEVKGHFSLVKCAKNVLKLKSNVRFVIVAGSINNKYKNSLKGIVKKVLNIPYDNHDRMKKLIDDYKLRKYFIFTGYRTDIPQLLCSTDIVIFPSLLAEGFGRPLIEGMASGVPVIASDVGPSKEILGENAGIFIKPGSNSDLTEAISILAKDSNKRKKLGKFGLDRVKNNFNFKNTSKMFIKIIDAYI